jgi:ribosomal protein S18 acetylase RimI-like enzyme
MRIDVRRENHHSLGAYATIPIAFEVREVVDVSVLQPGTSHIATRPLSAPYVKDYDAIPLNDPVSWTARHTADRWIILVAYVQKQSVGGAVLVTDPQDVTRLGGRAPSALLWDVRVHPDWRRRGIGRVLLDAADDAARAAGCAGIHVETQDINVAACRLYAASGYTLQDIIPNAYADANGETKLMWGKSFV